MKQQAEDKFDLVNSLLVSRVGMVGDYDHIRLGSALCELIRRVWIQRRRVQVHSMPSVNVRSARAAANLGTEREVVRNNK